MNPKTRPKTEINRAKAKESRFIVGGTALASESSLKKDWLRPEEDQAWNNL